MHIYTSKEQQKKKEKLEVSKEGKIDGFGVMKWYYFVLLCDVVPHAWKQHRI